jgi:hypothetical protein
MPERLDCSSRLFHEEIDTSPDGICREIENLDQWKDSTGRSLPGLPIVVEVTRNGTQVLFAIITKIEPQRSELRRRYCVELTCCADPTVVVSTE